MHGNAVPCAMIVYTQIQPFIDLHTRIAPRAFLILYFIQIPPLNFKVAIFAGHVPHNYSIPQFTLSVNLQFMQFVLYFIYCPPWMYRSYKVFFVLYSL